MTSAYTYICVRIMMNYYIEQLLLDTNCLQQSGLGGASNNLAASSCSVSPNAACVPILIFGQLKWDLDIRIANCWREVMCLIQTVFLVG